MSNVKSEFRYEVTSEAKTPASLVATRRAVLKAMIAGVGLCASVPAVIAAQPAGSPRAQAPAGATHAATIPWETLAGVQEILFPSEPEAPGAKDVNALGYLQATMARFDADPDERKFLLAGLSWIDGIARQDGHTFVTLNGPRQETLVHRMAASKDGENWLALVMYYIFEALLTDPVYGGNTNEVGWKWLHYIPGFPRPPIGKRYYELMGR